MYKQPISLSLNKNSLIRYMILPDQPGYSYICSLLLGNLVGSFDGEFTESALGLYRSSFCVSGQLFRTENTLFPNYCFICVLPVPLTCLLQELKSVSICVWSLVILSDFIAVIKGKKGQTNCNISVVWWKAELGCNKQNLIKFIQFTMYMYACTLESLCL